MTTHEPPHGRPFMAHLRRKSRADWRRMSLRRKKMLKTIR